MGLHFGRCDGEQIAHLQIRQHDIFVGRGKNPEESGFDIHRSGHGELAAPSLDLGTKCGGRGDSASVDHLRSQCSAPDELVDIDVTTRETRGHRHVQIGGTNGLVCSLNRLATGRGESFRPVQPFRAEKFGDPITDLGATARIVDGVVGADIGDVTPIEELVADALDLLGTQPQTVRSLLDPRC